MKSTVTKLVACLVLAFVFVFLAFAVLFLWLDYSWGQYTTYGLKAHGDHDLIAIYHTHQESFKKLQQMAAEDAQYGWYFNSSFEGAELDEKYRQEYEKDPQYAWYFKSPYFKGGKLDKARKKEYEDLVSEITPDVSIAMDYDGSIRFIFAGGGTSAIGSGWSKGIEYVPGSRETNKAVYGEWRQNGIVYQQWHGIVLTNLDSSQALPANLYMRQIQPNWYVYYQRDDD